MTKQLNRFLTGPLMPGSILILALLISLVSYAFMHPEQDGRIFFYPNNSGIEIGSERRSIPHRHDTADRIAVFLDELILGPQTLELTYALPRNTV
ncbi:MAG: hypothetical protein KAH21_02915, partial [Spirochaetaceae bacterium]|nr:hypothetical protein [Spirochaetaceae bacterium]